MKNAIIISVVSAATALFTSCGLIEKITEQDFEIDNFSFSVDTSPGRGDTRADGPVVYSGEHTILRSDFISDEQMDYAAVKKVTIGTVSIEVLQEVGNPTVLEFSLTGTSVESVTATDVPLSEFGDAVSGSLKDFIEDSVMTLVGDGRITVGASATFAEPLQAEKLTYRITLSDIVIRAGLKL